MEATRETERIYGNEIGLAIQSQNNRGSLMNHRMGYGGGGNDDVNDISLGHRRQQVEPVINSVLDDIKETKRIKPNFHIGLSQPVQSPPLQSECLSDDSDPKPQEPPRQSAPQPEVKKVNIRLDIDTNHKHIESENKDEEDQKSENYDDLFVS